MRINGLCEESILSDGIHRRCAMEIDEKTLKSIMNEQREEYQRYLGVLKEDSDAKFQLLAEQYRSINEKLASHSEKLASHSEMLSSHSEKLDALADDIAIMKQDVHFLKGALKKKVDYDEFEALEKRVLSLESKMRT